MMSNGFCTRTSAICDRKECTLGVCVSQLQRLSAREKALMEKCAGICSEVADWANTAANSTTSLQARLDCLNEAAGALVCELKIRKLLND